MPLPSLPINRNDPEVLHVDMNACFARAEQQAFPLWRGKPLSVTPILSAGSCTISPSYELKAFGVKTGMSNRDARMLSPNMILKQSNPPLYREVHRRFCRIFRDYSPDVAPKSIDEAVFYLHGCPALKKRTVEEIGLEIKERVKREIGPWMLVNVGIGCNAWQAKTAASLHKPDGLDRIDHSNLREVLASLELTDLCGIAGKYQARLNQFGIMTPLDLLDADPGELCRGPFRSIEGYYWTRRLKGYEEVRYDPQKLSYSSSVQLDRPVFQITTLLGVVEHLALRASTKMRRDKYGACRIDVHMVYADRQWRGEHQRFDLAVHTAPDVFRQAILCFNAQRESAGLNNHKGVTKLAVTLADLRAGAADQLSLFDGTKAEAATGFKGQNRDVRITKALDEINYKYGKYDRYALMTGSMVGIENYIWDRIAVNSITDLEMLYEEQEPWPVPARLAAAI